MTREAPMETQSILDVTKDLRRTTNVYGQPIGLPVPAWNRPPMPQRVPIQGRLVYLEPLHPDVHAADLFSALMLERDSSSWTYMHYGPFDSFGDYRDWMLRFCCERDPLFYAIVDNKDHKPKGMASYQRINPEHGTIEVGHLHFTPLLRQTAMATEAMYLMMRNAFLHGYRRYEWKCDALNKPSHEAARRLGFTFEGIFRQGNVYKGRNRDIAWYSILDSEWPPLREAFERWLSPHNFDSHGTQRTRLAEYICLCSPTWMDRLMAEPTETSAGPDKGKQKS